VRIYELMAETPSADERTRAISGLAATAMEHYLNRRWSEAIDGYDRILELDPDDRPSRIMKERCRLMLENPPPGDWSGIHHFDSK
jgi:adenylate cyclase